MIFAKVNTITNIVENIFEFEGSGLPEEFGNPIHYVQVNNNQQVSIGGTYDRENNVFYPPKLYDSWVLSDGQWIPPIEYPDDFSRELQNYKWNEETQAWDAI